MRVTDPAVVAAVIRTDGQQCAVYVDGRRCPNTEDLEVHRLLPDEPETLANGVALCEHHVGLLVGVARRLRVQAAA